MRLATRILRGSGLVLLVVFVGISAPISLLAQPPAATTRDTDLQRSERGGRWELTLHHAREACGRKWVKRLGALTEDEYAWMARYHHGLYEVSLDGRTLATIEILNSPNLRDCDLDKHWKTREMTIRVTYFFFDGSQKTQLTHIAVDPTFVNQAPKVYPLMGKALLIGVDAEGNARSRWLALEPLKALYAEAAGRQAEQNPVLASQ
jgi:hypothetical protein